MLSLRLLYRCATFKDYFKSFFPVRLIYSHSGQSSTEHKLVNVDQDSEWVMLCGVAECWHDWHSWYSMFGVKMVQLLECTMYCKTIYARKSFLKKHQNYSYLYLFTLFWSALSFTDSRGKTLWEKRNYHKRMNFGIGASESIMSRNKTHHNILLHWLFVHTFILIFAHSGTLLGPGHFTQ